MPRSALRSIEQGQPVPVTPGKRPLLEAWRPRSPRQPHFVPLLPPCLLLKRPSLIPHETGLIFSGPDSNFANCENILKNPTCPNQDNHLCPSSNHWWHFIWTHFLIFLICLLLGSFAPRSVHQTETSLWAGPVGHRLCLPNTVLSLAHTRFQMSANHSIPKRGYAVLWQRLATSALFIPGIG